MELEIDELFGLPAHPLLVHVPVVIIPLALLVALVALWPRARRGAALAAAALALVGAVGTVLAAGSGEELEDDVRETELVEEHAEQGEQVELPALAFAVLAIAGTGAVEAARRRRRDAEGTGDGDVPAAPDDDRSPGSGATAIATAPPPAPARARPTRAGAAGLTTALLALSVLAGAVATYTVVGAGHSGAEAVWDEAPASGTDDDD
jgi:uncharacterized membrane protein